MNVTLTSCDGWDFSDSNNVKCRYEKDFSFFFVKKRIHIGCPGHIWYVNVNLIYADLHRLPHVGFATFFYWF